MSAAGVVDQMIVQFRIARVQGEQEAGENDNQIFVGDASDQV